MDTQEQVEVNNILIAKFMGYSIEKRHFQYKSYNSSNEYYWANSVDNVVVFDNNIVENYEGEPVMNFEELDFHEWNTIIPVVKLIHVIEQPYLFDNDAIALIDAINEALIQLDLDVLYKAIVTFINWYNAKKKKP